MNLQKFNCFFYDEISYELLISRVVFLLNTFPLCHLKSFGSFYLFILLSIVVIIIGVVISIKLLTLSVNNN